MNWRDVLLELYVTTVSAKETIGNATLTGLDSDAVQIALGTTSRHPHCQFLQGDVLAGLPFAEGTFEYTHMRCMILAIPTSSWPFVIGELVRVTAPGIWIELFNGRQECERIGPQMRVIDHLSTMLCQAGAERVREQRLTILVGSWAGRIGEMMGKDLHALLRHSRHRSAPRSPFTWSRLMPCCGCSPMNGISIIPLTPILKFMHNASKRGIMIHSKKNNASDTFRQGASPWKEKNHREKDDG